LQYQSYDVTTLLKNSNEVKVTIGDGWWRGVFGGDLQNNRFGDDASVLFQLNIVYADGSNKRSPPIKAGSAAKAIFYIQVFIAEKLSMRINSHALDKCKRIRLQQKHID